MRPLQYPYPHGPGVLGSLTLGSALKNSRKPAICRWVFPTLLFWGDSYSKDYTHIQLCIYIYTHVYHRCIYSSSGGSNNGETLILGNIHVIFNGVASLTEAGERA